LALATASGPASLTKALLEKSFWLGALLTVAAFFGTLLALFLTWLNSRRTDGRSGLPDEPPAAA